MEEQEQEIEIIQHRIEEIINSIRSYDIQITAMYFQLNRLKGKRSELRIEQDKLQRDIFEINQAKEKAKEKGNKLTRPELKLLWSVIKSPEKLKKLQEVL